MLPRYHHPIQTPIIITSRLPLPPSSLPQKAKPEEAAPYMLKLLMLRNNGVSNADVGVSDVTESGSVLAISHEDQAAQAYINNRQLPVIFKFLLDKLLVDEPEDVFQCMAQGIAELQASQPAQ
ncbi:MAG: hypothetical protein WDW38_007075 [Sanguina aurantia]